LIGVYGIAVHPKQDCVVSYRNTESP
jgi:hypothetical protein